MNHNILYFKKPSQGWAALHQQNQLIFDTGKQTDVDMILNLIESFCAHEKQKLTTGLFYRSGDKKKD